MTRTLAMVVCGLLGSLIGICASGLVLSRVGALITTYVILTVLVGWSFVISGLLAWRRRSMVRGGPLLAVAGLVWFAHLLTWAHVPVLSFVGNSCASLYVVLLAHALLRLSADRPASRATRLLVLAAYLDAGPLHFVATALAGGSGQGARRAGAPGKALVLFDAEYAIGVVLALATLVVLLSRLRRADAAARRLTGPVTAAGGLVMIALAADLLGTWFAPGLLLPSFVLYCAALATVPTALLATLLRLRRAELQAELDGRMAELRASRVRVVEAATAERRRIERNLHDGAQQRLISTAMTLGLAEARLASDPAAALAALAEARDALAGAQEELRRLGQGIHPAVLTERGLRAAVEELVWSATVPVTVEWRLREPLTEAVEAAAYYLVAEALTNVVKHARADAAWVGVAREDGRFVVTVTDDGVGGADPGRGTGLRGLADRFAALDGRLVVADGPAAGTTLRGELPCE